jgi:integrase
LGRAQIEAGKRKTAEIEFDPLAVTDASFSPEKFAADALRPQRGPGTTKLSAMFDDYASEAGLAPATVKAWKRQIATFTNFLGHDDASRINPKDVVRWKDALLSEEVAPGRKRSARTVRDTYLAVVKSTVRWGIENHRLVSDPTAGISVRVPKKARLREKGLTDDEAEKILLAALQIDTSGNPSTHILARRWVPWLCAYTGARVNEMTQLRREDVKQIEKVWCVRITPEAGKVKLNEARIVPLHAHLVEQGFIKFVRAAPDGPLFYDPLRHRGGKQGNPQLRRLGSD